MRGIGESANVDILLAALKQSTLGWMDWRKEYTIKSDAFEAFYNRIERKPKFLTKAPSHYRVDIASPDFNVAIEVNGYYHDTPAQRFKDIVRRAMLNDADWFVVDIHEDNIPHNLDPFLDILLDTFRRVVAGKTASMTRKEILADLNKNT